MESGCSSWNYFTNLKEEGLAECKLCKQRLKNNRSHNLKLHIEKVHKNREEIDKYFEISFLENTATCKVCSQQLKNRRCNLRVHLRKLHKIETKPPEERKSPPPLPCNRNQIQAAIKVAKRKAAEQVDQNGKRIMHRLFIKIDKKTIVRSVVGLIVEDGVSPHVFGSKHFDAILRPMCETISEKQGKEFPINEAEIERIINSLASYMRDDFANDLSCRLLTIKIDNDLDALPNVFCVSAIFISGGEIRNRALGLIDLKDNAELQEHHIMQILYKFNIDSNQIISVFWDNTKSKYRNPVQNSEYMKEIELFKSYPEIYLGDVQIEPYLGSLAQLCLLDIFKNSKILQQFLECRNLVKFINDEQNGYLELLESKNLPLPQLDSPWHAGSTCKMMNTLQRARSFLQTVKFETPHEAEDGFNCNRDLWLFIDAFCESTNYLQKTILKYYSQELHIGDFYAQWLKCKLMTEKFSTANKSSNRFFAIILSEILKSLENITNKFLEKEHVIACLYMDPRFQHILNAAQKNIAVEYLKKLWSRSKLYIDDDNQLKNDAQSLDDEEDAFLNEFLSNDLNVKDKASNDVFRKIQELELTFQTADTNILSFWRELKISNPEVYTLSTICFAITATEIYTKTVYSHVYRLNNSKSEISAFTKENLLFLRLNAQLLDNSLAHLPLINDGKSIVALSSSDDEAAEESCEGSEDGNSNAALNDSPFTAGGEVSKISNADEQPLTEVKNEEIV